MTLLAISPGKFYRGIRAPGDRLSGRTGSRGTPWCALGEKAYYDWRKPPGDAENTAGIEPVSAVTALDRILTDVYATDAHFVCYILRKDGSPLARQPRVTKQGAEWIFSQGYAITLETLCADIDNPGHASWKAPEEARAEVGRVASLLGSAAVYATAHGLRVCQPLSRVLDIEESEGVIRAWLASLEAKGLSPDWQCADWTRVFRAPNVRRDRSNYRSPAVSVDRMSPVPPPAGVVVPRRRSGRRNPRASSIMFSRVVADTWLRLVAPMSRVLAGRFDGERHQIGLALAGALLGRRVPAEQVPALVIEIAHASGWDAEHHRAGAEDTVRRWADGYPYSGLSALPSDVREAFEVATDTRRAQLAAIVEGARPVAMESLDETTRKLTSAIRDAKPGLEVIRAACGLGKTHAARVVAGERSARSGTRKDNSRTVIATPTTRLALQVVNDLRAAGIQTTRFFGPLSLPGAHEGYECRYRAAGAALAEGGQSIQALFCDSKRAPCEHRDACRARTGQDEQEGARVFVGPHALLSALSDAAGTSGLVFIDEPPALLRDEIFTVDDMVHAEKHLEHFEPRYAAAIGAALSAVRAWTEIAAPEVSGPLARAFDRALLDPELERRALDATGAEDVASAVRAALERPNTPPPLDHRSIQAARGALGFAQRLGKASRVLRALRRAVVQPGIAATVYERGEGRSLALTGLDVEIENAILGARPDGEATDRRVVVAGADAHLHVDRYRSILGVDVQVRDFVAPDGAPIERVHLVCNGSRARLAGTDTAPIEACCRLLIAWATEAAPVATCGVVTFKKHASHVRRYLLAAAPGVRWEVAHYGATRGLDAWKDFDGVATIGDPRPNLDFVARELGEVGAEDGERRYERAEARARSELEQAHGRLRTVHRTRPGRALHVGGLLPGGWGPGVIFRRPPEGRIPRPRVEGLAELVEAVGGQRAAGRIVGRDHGTIAKWLRGERRPPPEEVAALRAASRSGGVQGGAGSPVSSITGHPAPPPAATSEQPALDGRAPLDACSKASCVAPDTPPRRACPPSDEWREGNQGGAGRPVIDTYRTSGSTPRSSTRKDAA